MVTYFVLYDDFLRCFVATGNRFHSTYSLNNAKHFTSEWSAAKFLKRCNILSNYKVLRVQRY